MTATLGEVALAIVLVIVVWQLGLIIAPSILRALRGLKRDVDEAAEAGLQDPEQNSPDQEYKEEQNHGTRH